MSGRALTRREALGALGGAAAWALAGCGAGRSPEPGSTLVRRLADPDGDGRLGLAGGLALQDRTELAPAATPVGQVALLAQLTDPHVRDAQSPARVPFLDAYGPRLGSAFRPQEALTAQVLAATVASIAAARPDGVLVTGDLADSAQGNELAWALTLLRGGTARPDSGRPGYQGVQQASLPDPLFYRPDVDQPRHPGLLRRATGPVRSPGLGAPWWPVVGNHDVLVQGELAPTPVITGVATGDRLVVSPGPELQRLARAGRIDPQQIDALLRTGVGGETLRVAPDARRAHLAAPAVVARLRAAAHRPRALGSTDRLDYTAEVGDDLLLVVLDLSRRDVGAGGLVTPKTIAALDAALDRAGERLVVVACHQPLHTSENAAPAIALLDGDPRVLAVIAGHTHRNAIVPRRLPGGGGYWLITTASIVDWPQQWRALRLVRTRGDRLALETWLVDHLGRPNDESDLAGIARDLAYLDAQGGRPAHAAGPATSRNVRLHLGARSARREPRRRLTAPAAPLPAGTGAASAGAGDALF